jgi:hypothetical protein
VLRLRPRVYDADGHAARNRRSLMDVIAGMSKNPSTSAIDFFARSINYAAREQPRTDGETCEGYREILVRM